MHKIGAVPDAAGGIQKENELLVSVAQKTSLSADGDGDDDNDDDNDGGIVSFSRTHA